MVYSRSVNYALIKIVAIIYNESSSLCVRDKPCMGIHW